MNGIKSKPSIWKKSSVQGPLPLIYLGKEHLELSNTLENKMNKNLIFKPF